MITIKNLKVFNCSRNESFHWSKLPNLKEKMENEIFRFPNYANLFGANLFGANLFHADLHGANLFHADLSYANLRSANLRNANLSNADLHGADLSCADLSCADLSNADLSCADLSYANLHGADLSYANLRNAKLREIDDKEVIIKDYISVTGLGSANRQTHIFNTNIGIVLQCGCFYGTEAQFEKKVKETHKSTNFEKEYLEMLKLAKIRFSRKGKDEDT